MAQRTPNGGADVEPVRLYAEEDRRLPRRLAQALRDKIENETAALVAEIDQTFEAVKRRQGYISGLQWALQECESADKELSG